MFGSSVDLGKVRLKFDTLMSTGGYARTLGNDIHFPGRVDMPWVIHELTHVWQHQTGGFFGYGYAFRSVGSQVWSVVGDDPYSYGGEQALLRNRASGGTIYSWGIEEQAQIVKAYYVRMAGGAATTAYEPYVNDIRSSR